MKGRNTLKKFSHIYVERDILKHPITVKILNELKNSFVIEIDRYGDVFNRPKQNYVMQKQSQNLILAKKRYDFIYKGSELCVNFGYNNFYHTSNILNCLYSCDYCYLQGMYPSANIVVFVNIEEFFSEVDKLTRDKKIYLSISYETDLLAFEPFIGFGRKWIEYAANNDNLLIEIRTKSANIDIYKDMEIPDNVIFAWSILPQPIIERYEKLTPSLDMRIRSIKKAISKGFNVRLSIEPIMYIDDFENIYVDFINKIFKELSADRIKDANIGVFRMMKEQAKKIERIMESSPVFCYDTEVKEGVFTYKNEEYMKNFVYSEVIKYIEKEKVFIQNYSE